jgi:hypothetical protein
MGTLQAGTLSFYGSYVNIPEGWVEMAQPTPNERYFLSEDQSATLNMAYYRSEALSSVNALAQHRVVSRFDGWMAILDRPAKAEELARVKANDGRIVVYNRQFIQNTNQIQEDVVGEYYYFVSPNAGYVVSVETTMSNWKEKQSTFRNIIDSFGIGGTPDPIHRPNTPMPPYLQTTDTFGRRIDITPKKWDTESPLKSHYPLNLGIPDIGPPHSWVLAGNLLYLQFQKHLTCVDLFAKKALWTFQMPGIAHTPIWEYRGILYMARQVSDGDVFVFAIQPDSGAVLFSENLGKNVLSAMGISKTMSFIQGSTVALFDLETRKITRTETEADQLFFDKSTPILAHDTHLIVAPDVQWQLNGIPTHVLGNAPLYYVITQSPGTTEILALSEDAVAPKWTVSLDNVHTTAAPILQGKTLMVFLSSPTHHEVLSLDIRTGKVQQRITLPHPVVQHSPFLNGVYVQFQAQDQYLTGLHTWDNGAIAPDKKGVFGTSPWAGTLSTQQHTWLFSQDRETLHLFVIKNI